MKAAIRYALVAGLALGSTALALPASAQDPVTISLWTIDQDHERGYHHVMAREFQEQYPHITVEVRAVQFTDMVNDLARGVATGNAPDVTYIDNPEVPLFASRGLLLDLTPHIEASAIIDPDDIYPGPRSSVTWDGGIYGIPRGANTLALYYNADMFREAGLDPDNPPQTWDELYEAAVALNDPARGIYGIAFSARASEEGTFQFLPWIQMAGANYDNVDHPGAIEALEFWKRLLDERLASPDTLIRSQGDSTGTFNAGNAAMVISGPWELPRMSREAQFEYRATLLPTKEPGGERASALGEGDNVILASTQHPEEAFLFVEYLYEQMPRVWSQFGFLPASEVEVVEPAWPEIFAVFQEQMQYARNRGPHPEWPRISQAIQAAIQSTLTGQTDAATALATAQASIDQVLGR